jgi:methylenetetrahydrofolate reductase (NADPH)
LGLLEQAYVLAGVGPLASAKAADWIRRNVAGVHIPDAVIDRLTGAQDQKQEGVDLCVDLIEQVREIEGISGVHIMAYRMEDRIGEIVTRSNALAGREPWQPTS